MRWVVSVLRSSPEAAFEVTARKYIQDSSFIKSEGVPEQPSCAEVLPETTLNSWKRQPVAL